VAAIAAALTVRGMVRADRSRSWWERRIERGVTAAERQQILGGLFGAAGQARSFWARYWLMLTLSGVIATAGLSSGSAAVVIGAMLLAPLMTPLLGFPAAVLLRMPRRVLRAALTIAASTVWVVAVSYLLTAILPATPLSAEVLARSHVDVRDLVVALAAGLAASWATTRPDVSAALPGVAIAVALVPPLAATGMVAQRGEWALAEGTLLLYLTNLVAIVAMTFAVYVVTGFTPVALLRRHRRSLAGFVVVLSLATAGLSWPLWQRAETIARQSAREAAAAAVVSEWVAAQTSLDLDRLQIGLDTVVVDVTGPNPPRDSDRLASSLSAVVGGTVAVEVRWSGRTVADAGVRLVDDIRPLVLEWLTAAGLPPSALDRLIIDDEAVTVRVASQLRPPPSASLGSVLEPTLTDRTLELVWVPLGALDDPPPPTETLEEAALHPIRDWVTAADQQLLWSRVTSLSVELIVAGTSEPPPSRTLSGALERLWRERALEPGPRLDVRWLRVSEVTLDSGVVWPEVDDPVAADENVEEDEAVPPGEVPRDGSNR